MTTLKQTKALGFYAGDKLTMFYISTDADEVWVELTDDTDSYASECFPDLISAAQWVQQQGWPTTQRFETAGVR